MINEIDQFFESYPEPTQSCLLALKDIILSLDSEIELAWKYKSPFFLFGGKIFCYLWVNKKNSFPYIGVTEGKRIDHPLLISENRKEIKVINFNPNEDIPKKEIIGLLNQCLDLHKNGIVKSK